MPENKGQCICPLCNADLGGHHEIEDICEHIYQEHLSKIKPVYFADRHGYAESKKPVDTNLYKYCLCWEWVVHSGTDLFSHIKRKHNGEFGWMYDEYHKQMLGAEP